MTAACAHCGTGRETVELLAVLDGIDPTDAICCQDSALDVVPAGWDTADELATYTRWLDQEEADLAADLWDAEYAALADRGRSR